MEERLPDFVISELFKDSLVYTGESFSVEHSQPRLPKQKPVNNSKPKKIYLGNYEKKIIVLVNDPENIYLSEDNLNFLTGILNACKFNLAHIALINFSNNPFSFSDLKKDLQPEYLVSFGITALQIELPFAMPNYQVQEYNKCAVLTAPALTELNQPTSTAKSEKTKLWKSLQKMFNL